VDELLAAIVAAPDDADNYLVYGDWLQSRGDPRGELIALHHAGEVDRANRLAFSLLPPLIAGALDRGLRLDWRLGFVERARLGRLDSASDAEARNVLDALLADPAGRVLRELVLDICVWDRWVYMERLWGALAAAPVPPPLRRLQIGDFVDRTYLRVPYPDRDISAVEVGDLSGLWTRLPQLEELELQGCHFQLGALDSPRLRSVELCTSTCGDEHLAAIRAPNLERLIVWCGDGEYGGGVTYAGLADLLRRLPPTLVELGIMNTVHSDDIAKLLPKLPVARQLRALDLGLGMLGDAGAFELTRRGFPALQELRVQKCYLSPAALAELKSWCPRVLGEAARDPDAQRYVSVSE
jgi:uncharacterized protein (TIGR02996 family)